MNNKSMINIEHTLKVVDDAINALDTLSLKFNMYRKGVEPYESTFKVLQLLKIELVNNSENMNNRVLRAMHDVGMSSYKDFENTEMETLIDNIVSILYNEVRGYKDLKPLRGDFGKSNPI